MSADKEKPFPRYTFSKDEKLKSKKLIDRLFARGKGISANPVRLVYLVEESDRQNPLALFTVSKKNFKKAVDRNRIKRQMREIYRLNRDRYFPAGSPNPYLLGFIYMAKEKIPYKILEKKLNLALERLKDNSQ